MTVTTRRTLRRAVRSTPAPGVTVMAASMSACCVWPAAFRASMACCWVIPAGICWLTTPSNRMSVALPRSFGPMTANVTLTIARPTTRTIRARLGSERADQPAEGALEVLGLLGRQPGAAERAAAHAARRRVVAAAPAPGPLMRPPPG